MMLVAVPYALVRRGCRDVRRATCGVVRAESWRRPPGEKLFAVALTFACRRFSKMAFNSVAACGVTGFRQKTQRLRGDDLDGGGPSAVSVQFDSHHMRSRSHLRLEGRYAHWSTINHDLRARGLGCRRDRSEKITAIGRWVIYLQRHCCYRHVLAAQNDIEHSGVC